MYARGIQRLFAVTDPQETGALLKCLGPEFRHLQQFLTVLKTAVGFAVFHDVLCQRLGDTGDIGKERCGCRIQIHTHTVYAALYNTGQRRIQFLLVHIVLVLPYADGLGIDLDQFCQRILQAARNGCCAALSHIKLRKLFRRQFASRIYGCSRFIHDHIGNRTLQFFDETYDHLLRFTGCRAVAQRDQIHVVFVDQFLQFRLGFRYFILRCGRIDHFGIQYLTRRIHDGQFTSGTERRVPAKYDFAADGLLHQQLLQIAPEYGDSSVLCRFRQFRTDLTFHGRLDQTLICIFIRPLQMRRGIRIVPHDHLLFQVMHDLLLRRYDLNLQYLLRFPAV